MKYFSITQAAQQLEKSRQWIWFLIKTGRMPAIKIGNQYAIEAESIKQFIQQTKEGK